MPSLLKPFEEKELDDELTNKLVPPAPEEELELIYQRNELILRDYENEFRFHEIRMLQKMAKWCLIKINNSNFLD